MFARLHTLFVALFFAIPLLAVGTAIPRGGDSCTTGEVQCCQSVQNSGSTSNLTTTLFGLIGVVVGDLGVNVGLTCSPISVIGVGGNSCSAQTVCCENNSFNGVIALGCTPINVGL
ncbi:fungal hydrophobin [Guyanagaster necrorhizus]|uniref:Hydrophobin n=1 Tax=Guyanagaster necrorhizus TaxID=856835 RepID=A0A9P7VKJ6_9AGAR|nr:fungal hydrophobin [Guyanagaster necrorhizus MCA 3950]KAG7442197.1 fungal hydrophobin [Guyanagaster necrorhizus MCA 3950]